MRIRALKMLFIGLNELVSTTLGNLVCLPFLSAMSS